MVNEFKKWTGRKKRNVEMYETCFCFFNLGFGKAKQMDRLHLNPYDGTHVHYQDPITAFPDKMDELLIALNKVNKCLFRFFILNFI
jgi:hypothetical protein